MESARVEGSELEEERLINSAEKEWKYYNVKEVKDIYTIVIFYRQLLYATGLDKSFDACL